MPKAGFNWVAAIAVVALVLVAAVLTGYIKPVGTTGSLGGSVGGTPPAGGLGSTANPTLDVTVSSFADNTTDAPSTVVVLKDGAFVSTNATSAGFKSITGLAANTAYTLEVVNTGSTNNFYPFQASGSTGAAGPNPVSLTYKYLGTTAPTMTAYKFDNITANTSSARQALGVNDSGTFRLRVRTASYNPDANVYGDGVIPILWTVDFNNQAIAQVTMKGTDNSDLQATGVPGGHSIVDTNIAIAGSSAAFLSNINQLRGSTDYDFYITVRSGSIEPIGTSDINGNLIVEAYDGFRYKNNHGAYVEGYINADTLADLGVTSSGWLTRLYYS